MNLHVFVVSVKIIPAVTDTVEEGGLYKKYRFYNTYSLTPAYSDAVP